MEKSVIIILIGILLFSSLSCSKKKKQNMVDFNQIDTDGYNNLKYQFREEIEKEKENKRRYKKGPFE